MTLKSPKRKTLKIGLQGQWNTIQPGLQHTLFGDLVLSNQFEALVGSNDNEVSIPLAARSWEISDDFRVFRFKIDNSKRFSDGSYLTATDFKRSWEDAAKLKPRSANIGLLDVLYKIEGYDNFAKSGSISGINAIDKSTLEITFATPFRMALEHLQGCRFAAYKEKNKKFIGTGPFVIEDKGDNHVLMRPLPNSDYPNLDVKFIPSDKIVNQLLSGEIDAIHYMSGHSPDSSRLVDPAIGLLLGQSAIHLSLCLNSTKSSIFSKRERRAALFSLVAKTIAKERTYLPRAEFFEQDVQFFMPLQAGRLSDSEIAQIILDGEKYIPDLVRTSKEKPIVAKLAASTRGVLPLLKATGLAFSPETEILPAKNFLELTYSDEGPDILVAAFSVAHGDPDGIYHILGKNGAIRSPYVYSEKVGQLLEEGRSLLDFSHLDEHYQKVSRALLTEVPMVHLGFGRALTAYRKDRVEIDTTILRRNQGQLNLFRAK